jgi:hypothetical protein
VPELIAGLHAQLHRLPGMPPHSEAGRLNQRARRQSARPRPQTATGRHPALHHHDVCHANPPRVLVAWQNWIGGLVAGRAGR